MNQQLTDNERQLVARMASGDDQALAAFYDRFGKLAYSLAYQIVGDSDEAEEVVADAFLQMWRSAASFDPARASVAAWVSMITRTRALDRLRASKRRSRVVELAAGGSAGTGEEAAAIPLSRPEDPVRSVEVLDLRARVSQHLAELPANQRQVIELAFYGGLTHSEIAEQLNEPLGTVKTRIRAAMSKLRASLAPYQQIG